MKKDLLLLLIAIVSLSFATISDFSQWSVKSKKNSASSTQAGLQTYTINEAQAKTMTVFFDMNDTLVITEMTKYTGNKKAKRKLEVITNTLNSVYSGPVTNVRPNKLVIPVKTLTSNNTSKADWYEILEVVNLNGNIKKSQVIRFSLN